MMAQVSGVLFPALLSFWPETCDFGGGMGRGVVGKDNAPWNFHLITR
jgi:hypothetical protein